MNRNGFSISLSFIQTFERCIALGICQTRPSYRNLLDDLHDGVSDYLRQQIQKGKEIRVTFDNFDFRILTNIIISGYKNSDMHWICQHITFDRVVSSHLDDLKPLVADIAKFENQEYLLSKDELQIMRYEHIVLVSRILVEFFPFLKVIKRLFPFILNTSFQRKWQKSLKLSTCQCFHITKIKRLTFANIWSI